MVLGVGTGSKVAQLIEALKERKIQLDGAVSSSRQTSQALAEARIPELDLNSAGDLALYIDGADEAPAGVALIKGGAAALTPEKAVAASSANFSSTVSTPQPPAAPPHFPPPSH